MVDFRRLVSKQTAAMGQGRREGKWGGHQRGEQKEAHCFHMAAGGANGPLIPSHS